MDKKLIITGASGFLGYHLMRIALSNWQVHGLVNNHNSSCEGATIFKCDITNYLELGNLLDDLEPDAVIHLAAIADANLCQQAPELSYAVNVEATKNLAGICSDYRIPFVFTSTDLVFDGLKGMYNEDDAKNPVSIYGEHKSLAEDEVLKIYPEALIARIPLMFGSPLASQSNYLQKFIAQSKTGEKAFLFTDEFRSVCGAKSISEGILKLFETNSGLIHIAGAERLSRYDFGLKAAKAFGLDEKLIQAASQKDVKMAANRPPDVSLSISKAIALGYSPFSVDEELAQIANNNYL